MSFEIAPVGANAVNSRPDIALLQANAASALAKISGELKPANVAQVAPTNPPAGLVSSLAATQTAITSTQNAVNVGRDFHVIQAEQVRSGGVGGFFTKQHYEVTIEIADPRAITNPRAIADIAAQPQTAGMSLNELATRSQNDQAAASAKIGPAISSKKPEL